MSEAAGVDVWEDVAGVHLLPRDDVDRAVAPEGSPVRHLEMMT